MAGSLGHIVDYHGRFNLDGIENMGDATEALEECFQIIHTLSGGDYLKAAAAYDPKISVYDNPEVLPFENRPVPKGWEED